MKRTIRLGVVLLAAMAAGNPQSLSQSTSANSKILTYISSGWNTLSRSMTDCKSLVDPKVTTAPVLYLPAGMETPSAVSTAHQQCNVEIKQLPRKITHIGDVGVAEIPVEGLLYLPNRYVVPGGRFNEMYGWDSYFIILGLVEDEKAKRTELARGMVENFFFEIEITEPSSTQTARTSLLDHSRRFLPR
jgi:alpha,alpha-trehalase